MDKTYLSIITPVFNGANNIEACIKNVIDQNVSGIEHVIVDGLSQDGTVEIIKKYAANYPHIRFISEKDTGLPNALNKGVRMARGKIVSILNSDDYYSLHTLSRALDVIKNMPEPAFLVGNCNVLIEHDKIQYVNRPECLRMTYLLMGSKSHHVPANPSAYFYHKSLHDIVGDFDENEPLAFDFDFLFRAIPKAHVKYIDELWGNCRIVPGTKTHSDMKSGNHPIRLEALIRRHIEKLPIVPRIYVKCKRHIYYRTKIPYYQKRLVDYIRNPSQIITFVKKRLGKFQEH